MSKLASRRKHQRIGCLVSANILVNSMVYDVKIINFCEHGLLVDAPPTTYSVIERHTTETGHFITLSCLLDETQYQMELKISRSEGQYFGLFASSGLPKLFFTSLQNQISAEIPEAGHFDVRNKKIKKRNIEDSRQRLLLQDLLFCCQKNISCSINQYFEHLPEVLMSNAEKALAENHVQVLFEASSLTRTNCTAMIRKFWNLIQEDITLTLTKSKSLSQLPSQTSGVENQNSNLNLVDLEVFDSWISVKSAAQRIENQVHEQFVQVINRFKPIFESPEESALLPRGQAKILEIVLSEFNYRQKPLKIALDFFSKRLMTVYQNYLEAMNVILEKHGFYQSRAAVSINKNKTSSSTANNFKQNPGPTTTYQTSNDNLTSVNQVVVGGSTITNASISTSAGTDTGTSQLGQEPSVKSRMVYVQQLIQNLQDVKLSADIVCTISPLSKVELIEILNKIYLEHWSIFKADISTSNELLHNLQAKIKLKNRTLTLSDTASVELVDAFFNSMVRNQYLIKGIQGFIDTLRTRFAIEFLENDKTGYEGSSIRDIIFSLHSIAHEPMSWSGRHKEKLLDAFNKFAPYETGDFDFKNAIVSFKAAIDSVKMFLDTVKEKNLKRLIESSQTKHTVAKKRNEVQQFLHRFVDKKNLVPKWFEKLMRFGWCEHLCFLAIRDKEEQTAYEDAKNLTQLLVDIISHATHTRVELDVGLKDSACEALNTVQQTLTEYQSDSAGIAYWYEQVLDLLNGHENELLYPTPPSHWYIPASQEYNSGYSRYYQYKLDHLSEGDWFYCPQFEREKIYLQLAWIAPDQSKYLLVNHSYVNSGEYSAKDFLSLLTSPGTHHVTEAQLPFQPKGIESNFDQIYDRMLNGYIRDEITGFIFRADFERYLQKIMAKRMPFAICVATIKQAQAITSVYGSSQYQTALTLIAYELTELKNNWSKKEGLQALHFCKITDDSFAFCFTQELQSDELSSQTVQGQDLDTRIASELTQYCRYLNSELKPILITANLVNISFKFSAITMANIGTSSVQVPINAVLEQAKKTTQYKTISKVPEIENLDIDFVTLEHLKVASQHQASAEWSLKCSLETMSEKITIETWDIYNESGELVYQRIAPVDIDPERPTLDHLITSERCFVLDQWVLLQAQRLSLNKSVPVIVSLNSNQFPNNQFFEFLFDIMSKVPKTNKLHFCFDMNRLPAIDLLTDFSHEVKSYGAALFLRNWGLAPQSFQVLQYSIFDSIIFEDSLTSTKNPKIKQLFHQLESVLNEYEVQMVITFGSGQFRDYAEQGAFVEIKQ